MTGPAPIFEGDLGFFKLVTREPFCPAPFGGEEFQTNLIMPEPCPFLSRSLPPCSVIRPTATNGVATGVVQFLTAMGLFIGQSSAFFTYLQGLATAADAATRGGA